MTATSTHSNTLHPAIAQALAPYAPPQSSVQSRKLTVDQIYDLLTEQHALYVDDPLYLHITINFEGMADQVARAERCLNHAEGEEAGPAFGGAYARLGALNLQQVAV